MRTKVTTWIGGLMAIFGALNQPQVLALIPGKYSAGISAAIGIVGVVLTALGRSLLAPTNAPPPNNPMK